MLPSDLPPCTLICRIQSEDVQVFLWLLWVSAHEAISVLMQVIDQIPIEAVFRDDVNGACEDPTQSCVKMENKKKP